MTVCEKGFDRLPIVYLRPACKSTGKEPMVDAKQLIWLGHRSGEDHHEIPQLHWQESQRPTASGLIQGLQQHMQMPGPLKEHAVGRVLTFFSKALENVGLTARQQRP
jgi:hypothetical protein